VDGIRVSKHNQFWIIELLIVGHFNSGIHNAIRRRLYLAKLDAMSDELGGRDLLVTSY
jgi:hypothetical protein